MIQVEKNKTLYIFSEEFEYNKENPQDTNFGFKIWINCGGIPDFIHMFLKKEESCKIETNGWEREYRYKDGILTQIYKTKKDSDNITSIAADISESKMKQVCDAMWDIYLQDWPKIITKRQEMADKISQTKKKGE